MLKLNKKSTIILSFAGSLLSLAALLIFMLLPTSDFANSVDHSAKDALMVFILAPVLSLVGSVSFIYAIVKDFRVWSNALAEPLVKGLTALYGAMSLFNIALYFSYLFEQFSLGFVAPYSGTVYEYLAVIAAIFVILKFFFTAIVTIAVSRK